MSLITTVVAPSENPLYQSSSSPSPSPSPAANAPTLLPSIPSVDHILDVISVYLITSLFLFSLFSLLLILYLRIRSFHRRSRLRSFATHSSQRLLLVSLVSLWALSELLRIPLYRLHALSTPLQIHLCNLHLILSLGFFQPAFLLSLHFLLNTSLKTNNNNNNTNNNNLSLLFSLCLPLCLALYLVTYQLHSRVPLPGVFYQSVAFFDDSTAHGCKAVLCTYPLLSAAIFGVFSVAYAVSLLFKSWKVISMAINKRLASRINLLSFTVLMCLAVQVVLMSLTVFFTPVGAMYYFIVFVIFVSVLVCAVVGEGILVIIPILDALSTTIVARKDVRDEEELNE